MAETYQAFLVSENNGVFSGKVMELSQDSLPQHPVLVRVHYSGLNYKDALSAAGNKGVTKSFPHTPGIDAAGVVMESDDPRFRQGDRVIVTSYDLGMNTPGGFGEYIRIPGDWIVPLPETLTLRESMILGTAGLTAAQGIHSMLLNGQQPDAGPVLVTGARGAVGSMALMILSHLGFEVIAAVSALGPDTDQLLELGATRVVDKTSTFDESGRPLLRSEWAGVFDVVGGNTLSTVLKKTAYGGNVVVVGNIGGASLETTVYPFILNGIRLLGVGTQDTPMTWRRLLWARLANEWKPVQLEAVVREISLNDLAVHLQIMQNRKSRGRVLLNLQA